MPNFRFLECLEVARLVLLSRLASLVRGGITKKNGKIWDNVRIGGGGVKKKQKCPNFNLGHLKAEGGGLYFSKMSQLELALRHHPK